MVFCGVLHPRLGDESNWIASRLPVDCHLQPCPRLQWRCTLVWNGLYSRPLHETQSSPLCPHSVSLSHSVELQDGPCICTANAWPFSCSFFPCASLYLFAFNRDLVEHMSQWFSTSSGCGIPDLSAPWYANNPLYIRPTTCIIEIKQTRLHIKSKFHMSICTKGGLPVRTCIRSKPMALQQTILPSCPDPVKQFCSPQGKA